MASTSARLTTNRRIEAQLAAREHQRVSGEAVAALDADELEKVRLYTGYGGIEDESTIGTAQMTEYYTPPGLVRKMWALVHHYHPQPIRRVLDPAVGSGRFLEGLPATAEVVDAYDVSPGAVLVARALHGDRPGLTIRQDSFESLFFENRTSIAARRISEARAGHGYDVVIGNPPYGTFQGTYAGLGEKAATAANSLDEYFITRGLDLLIPGGVLCYVIGGSVEAGSTLFLDRERREGYHAKLFAKAQLLDAYRLPQSIFLDTDVSTEIVVFRKRA